MIGSETKTTLIVPKLKATSRFLKWIDFKKFVNNKKVC